MSTSLARNSLARHLLAFSESGVSIARYSPPASPGRRCSSRWLTTITSRRESSALVVDSRRRSISWLMDESFSM